METFRKLANSIFFKIILAFVALSFVLFGVSSFILGSPNTWVAKIGSDNVSYNQFNNALRADREVILASAGENEEAKKYLDSDRFKSDVLGRIVNQIMIKNLSKDFDILPSKKIILESIAKDPSFKNESGKFDHKKFEEFLKKNGLNEERYVSEISSNVAATMILQSLSLATPVSDEIIAKVDSFKKEKRSADLISIAMKDVAKPANPTAEELEKFFKENQAQYSLPELRKVSYLTFSKKDFVKDLQISDQEIFAEYEKNKEQFTKPETRGFYNVVFDKEADAKNFLTKLEEATKSDKSKTKAEFEKLAKELAKKDLKAIKLPYLSQKDLVPQVAEPVFKLAVNEFSQVIQSPLGFHVFLLNDIKQPQLMPFSEVKNGIKLKLAEGREEKIMQEKISAIDDLLLTSNSLEQVAKKFNLKLASAAITIDAKGNNSKGEVVSSIKDLTGFSQNVFAAKEKQASKIFVSEKAEFYAFFIDEVTPSKQQELAEVKEKVTADLMESKKVEALREFAHKIEEEVRKDPNSIAKIAAAHHLKFDKAREFPRIIYLNFQGRQLPYQNQFLKDLFAAKVGEAIPAAPQAEDTFVVGVLREVKKAATSQLEVEQLKMQAKEEFRNEVMTEYNSYLLARYPVQTNDKVFGKQSKEQE